MSAIHYLASVKAFAKIEMLGFQIRRDAVDLECGYYGGDISREQFVLVAEGSV